MQIVVYSFVTIINSSSQPVLKRLFLDIEISTGNYTDIIQLGTPFHRSTKMCLPTTVQHQYAKNKV